MKNIFMSLLGNQVRAARFLALLAFCALFSSVTFAQTGGGTQIKNQASATYDDASDPNNHYTTISNTVTITVANVSGMTITPDGGSHTTVVTGQQNVPFSFHLTNTGNFDDQFRFLANNASFQVTGGTVVSAFIDADSSGTFTSGDTTISDPTNPVLSGIVHQNGAIDVVVLVNVTAASGSSVSVVLGDATTGSGFDNQLSDSSIHEVRTVATSVNGLREGRGDITAVVATDAQLKLTVAYPATATLGSDLTYTWSVCNPGARAAVSTTLSGAPSGSNTGIFIIVPVPVGTTLKLTQTFPTGTLFTTAPLTTAPTAAAWTTSPSSSVTRVAYNLGSSLAAGNGTCTNVSPVNPFVVTINTLDATLDIFEIGDVFANNSIGAGITDQSNDNSVNAGDGNANFDETSAEGSSDLNGYRVVTVLTRIYNVLIGPAGAPAATGPTNSTNDDFTNRSVTTGIAGVASGFSTTDSGQVVFTNTIKNTGNANDTFDITLGSAPSGFTVEISTNGGGTYVPLNSTPVNVPVNFNATADIKVRVTAPLGQTVLSSYPVVVHAASHSTPANTNDTIDRLYTGALRLDKSSTIINGTGVGGATDAVPGAIIEYTITYTNITSTNGTGSGSSGLTLQNIVITEDGSALPNNWKTTTTHVVGSGVDSFGLPIGTISGDTAGSWVIKDTITTLAPGASGTFKFRRTIN